MTRRLLRLRVLSTAALLACLAATSAVSAQPYGAVPAGLPAKMMVGLSENSGGTWMTSSGVPWNSRYQYLTKGWSNNWGYGAHDGSYALGAMQQAAAASMVPVLTYYQMIGEPGGGEANWSTVVQNASSMADYFGDVKLLLQQAKAFGKPVIIHLEPDGFGFLERQTTPSSPAAIASSGVAELAGLPNTVAGFGMAFLQLRKALGATNVIYAIHVSTWATGYDFSKGTTTDALQPYVDTAYAFLQPLGVGANQTGATFDLLSSDVLDRDSDYYTLTQNQNTWWDASDTASINSMSFNRYAEWLRLWNLKVNKRWMIWQIPLGNSNHLDVYNNGGSRQGYKDNRPEYFFASGTAHVTKFANVGVVGLLFGAGQTGQSSYTNDYYTDGQLFMKSRVGAYYTSGGVTLPGGSTGGGTTPTVPAFSATATISSSIAAPGATVTITATVTDTGAALSNGVVDLELHGSSGALAGQKTFSAESFSASQTKTYSWSWTASATAGVYTLEINVFGAGSTPEYGSNAAAGTVTVQTSGDAAQYSFEAGAQGFLANGGIFTSVAASTAKAYQGTHSLALGFGGTSAGTNSVYVASPSIAAGKTVTFHFWLPSGSKISSVQPYVQQGASGGWTWTGGWYAVSSLTAGAWNTLTVQVPANATAPLYQAGLQISTSAAWSGTAYLDSISW